MKHIDLFSGIGGFALAVDTVWPNSEHIFCDDDPFCQQVLKKHWPQAQIYGDIRTLTNTENIRHTIREAKQRPSENKQNERQALRSEPIRQDRSILTGGFPCQPFSQAGRRQGTADDRYLWPEMFRVIREFKPTWVIAENVRGLLTWNEGLVLEQVCADLESEGYEVQPLIIPAVAVNAPHRRDRVWFVGYSKAGSDERHERKEPGEDELGRAGSVDYHEEKTNWDKNWVEVAAELCGVDDGLPAELDGFKLSKAGHRKERLKSLGNAIVPHVAIEIMRAICGKR